MERICLYIKEFANETNLVYRMEYSLLICSVNCTEVYGVEIKKAVEGIFCEAERVEGLTECKKDAENFLFRLAEGLAMPMELTVLCDDFIGEMESVEKELEEAAS